MTERSWSVRKDWTDEVYDEQGELVDKLPLGTLPAGPVRPGDVARALAERAKSMVLSEDQVLALAALAASEDAPNKKVLAAAEDEDPDEWIQQIGEDLRTQDNRFTAHPVFLVQQLEEVHGIDSAYTNEFVWVDDQGEPVDAPADEDNPPEDWERVGVLPRWTFVQAFFTERGAKAFVGAMAHRLREPRIYVETGYRNPEWQHVRALLGADPHRGIYLTTRTADGTRWQLTSPENIARSGVKSAAREVPNPLLEEGDVLVGCYHAESFDDAKLQHEELWAEWHDRPADPDPAAPRETWGWSGDPDSEWWDGPCETREAAIEEGRALHAGAPFWITRGVHPGPQELMPSLDTVFEWMRDEADELAGEASEGWPSASTDAAHELGDYMAAWFERHVKPDWWARVGEPECIDASEDDAPPPSPLTLVDGGKL